MQYEILLVDDEHVILDTIGPALEEKGYKVTSVDNGKAAIELIAKRNFDLVITDLVMDEPDGIEVLKNTKELSPETMVIILTGFGDMTSAIEALRSDADDYILKPCEPEEMYFRVSKCLEKLEFKRKIKIYEYILPVCYVCKKIRDASGREPGAGNWIQMENYIRNKAGVAVTSTFCPECAKKELDEIPRELSG